MLAEGESLANDEQQSYKENEERLVQWNFRAAFKTYIDFVRGRWLAKQQRYDNGFLFESALFLFRWELQFQFQTWSSISRALFIRIKRYKVVQNISYLLEF